MSHTRRWLTEVSPGVFAAMTVAAVATATANFLPAAVGPVVLAVLLGLVIANLTELPDSLHRGLGFTGKRILRLGVVLLGARLSLSDVAEIGGGALLFVIACMTFVLGLIALLAYLSRVPPRLAILLGVGTAVCGNSAIMATAPIIRARDREISFAIATITLIGTAALLIFPVVGHLFEIPDRAFGLWAGLAINDTSQVVAAGAAHSPEALEVATVVKLVRNALMAPVIIGISWWSVRSQRDEDSATHHYGRSMRAAFPTFVLGFVVLVALRSLGLVPDDVAGRLGQAAALAITVAIAAVGLSTRIRDLVQVGLRPFLIGLATAVALAAIALAGAVWSSG